MKLFEGFQFVQLLRNPIDNGICNLFWAKHLDLETWKIFAMGNALEDIVIEVADFFFPSEIKIERFPMICRFEKMSEYL